MNFITELFLCLLFILGLIFLFLQHVKSKKDRFVFILFILIIGLVVFINLQFKLAGLIFLFVYRLF
ncbi:hypothetical protein ACOI1C_17440 [Bacillus sp. DJP31]|uniref:hypothetical protein n=1 Tax=Bacillus sp. DJP31 TaxID=3409789 RepID=UPI003BB7B521